MNVRAVLTRTGRMPIYCALGMLAAGWGTAPHALKADLPGEGGVPRATELRDQAREAAQGREGRQVQILRDVEQILRDVDDKALIDDRADRLATDVAPRKWLGLICTPVDDALRAHVDLPEGTGLLVQQIVPESPAEQAGLRRHDILMSAAERPLKSVEDLIGALNDVPEGPLVLEWIRKGERMTKEVTPADRPAAVALAPPDAERYHVEDELGRVQAWVERLVPGKALPAPAPRMRMRFFGPGMEMHAAPQPQPMPRNLTVRIERRGDEPARITVTRDETTWEVGEDDLDQLPDDVRPHVERMLGKADVTVHWAPAPTAEAFRQLERLHVPKDLPQLEKRLEEMNQRLEELFQRLQQLSLPGDEAPESAEEPSDA